jgi:hypothetical protein
MKNFTLSTVKINIVDLKYWALLFFCFFPYLNLLRLGTDTQPNALIFALYIFLININKAIPKNHLVTFTVFFISVFILLISGFSVSSILSFSNYCSILIVPIAVYFSLKKFNGLSYKFFKYCIYTWLIVGLIQRFIASTFLTFLLSRSSGIALDSSLNTRGVVALAPEPTYYGSTVLLFLIIYLLNFYEKKDYKLLFILLFQLVFLSLSSTSIFVLIASGFLLVFLQSFKAKFKTLLYTFLGVFFLTFSLYLLGPLYSNTRIYNILNVVISNPQLIFLDQSISERFNAIYFSISSLFENFGLPKGFNTYQNYIFEKSLLPEYKIYFMNYSFENYSRILSGFGMGFYELGIFGLLIPMFIFLSIKNQLKKINILFVYVLFNLLLFTAMSLNNSAILFVIGNLVFLNETYKKSIA